MFTKHPQFDFKINENYYSSELNRFIAERCRTDIVVNDIDLIIRYYKDDGRIRIIECKHLKEKFSTGQFILLEQMQKKSDVSTFILFGDYPFEFSYLYAFATKSIYLFSSQQLIDFVNNKMKSHQIEKCFVAKVDNRDDIYKHLKQQKK
jgi:hypothetical protein